MYVCMYVCMYVTLLFALPNSETIQNGNCTINVRVKTIRNEILLK